MQCVAEVLKLSYFTINQSIDKAPAEPGPCDVRRILSKAVSTFAKVSVTGNVSKKYSLYMTS